MCSCDFPEIPFLIGYKHFDIAFTECHLGHRLSIKQPPSKTFISGEDAEESEWAEFKLDETNLLTIDKQQQVNVVNNRKHFCPPELIVFPHGLLSPFRSDIFQENEPTPSHIAQQKC